MSAPIAAELYPFCLTHAGPGAFASFEALVADDPSVPSSWPLIGTADFLPGPLFEFADATAS